MRDGVIADGNFILEETKEEEACIATPVEASAEEEAAAVASSIGLPQTLNMIQLLKVTVKVILIFGSFHKMFHKSYYSNLELVCININCEFCSYLNPSVSL